MPQYDVVGFGNALVDVLAPADDAFLLKHSIAKGVMTLIDEFRARQLYEAFSNKHESGGGSGANTMAGLASLGASSLYVGKVKDDALGESFASSMRGIGVHYTTAMATGGPETGRSLIAVTPDGERSMSTYLGASCELGPGDVDAKTVASAPMIYVEGYLWDQPDPKLAIKKAMAAAKDAGAKVAFTLSDPFWVSRWRDEFRVLLNSGIDILFANEAEAKALFEVEEFDDVVQALRGWPGIASVSRSEKGCVVMRGREFHVIDAVPGVKVIDTTGAGDQYAAGFLYGLSRAKPLADCGKLGCVAAAEVISHFGPRPETSLKALAAKANLL